MTYIRPASSQMDLWPSLGLELDWKTLFACSKKGEHFQPPSAALTALGASYDPSDHGYKGPLATCISPHILGGDIHNVFNATFKKLGIPPRHEFNGGDLRGFGIQQVTQDGIADIREDAARAYYFPVMNRPNLIMMVNTTATRLIWAGHAPGRRAVARAAEVSSQTGKVSTIRAKREIILSAGALRSPAILEHSGVGNPSILSRQSVEVKVDLPSVGENLQDQTVLAMTATALQEYPLGIPPFVAHASLHDLFGAETLSLYNSTFSKLPSYASTITASNNGASNASTQQHLLRTQLDLLLDSNTVASEIAPIVLGDFVGAVFWPLQPFSRGNVHINSTKRTAQPRIDPRFFEIDFDIELGIATAKFVRRVLTTPPFVDLVNVTSLSPGYEVVPEDAGDDIWLKWLKGSMYQPNYHHLGTCAMLPKEMGGVVDNEFRVYGTENVRVVDLSVVPLQVAGHSMSLLYGIAEWAAVKIKKDCYKA
jgi:choline dehydrogenase-like flavoprotein